MAEVERRSRLLEKLERLMDESEFPLQYNRKQAGRRPELVITLTAEGWQKAEDLVDRLAALRGDSS